MVSRSSSGKKNQFKWTLLLLTALMILEVGLLRAEAGVTEDQVTLSLKNATLQKVFEELKKQTGYHFVYRDEVLRRAHKVDVQVTRAMLKDVLLMVFKNQPLTYTIVDRIIVIRTKETEPVVLVPVDETDKGVFSVRGQVMNDKGEPVPGASVIVKNTKKTAVSNDRGEFSLEELEENTVLVVSSVGYQTKEMIVKAGGNLSVYLKKVINNLDEAVVVAYNTTTQRANTGAVTVVKGEQISTLPNRSFDKSLQGLVPGLFITSGDGQPGSPPSNFVLRGIATGGQPNNGETFRNPLIVVDGVPVSQDPPSYILAKTTNPIAQLNPSDIESISVLKDAAAVALYGSKASNGVILVTTKKGKTGKTVFSFRNQTDISSPMDGKVKMLNQQEYLDLLYETYRNSDPSVWTDEAILKDLKTKFPTQPDGSFYPPSDWSDALFNKAAITMTNEISMSGGNEKSNFYLNLEYTKQNGVVKKTGYNRKSIRFNFEHRAFSWLKLGVNTALSYNLQDYSDNYNFLSVASISPLNPIKDLTNNFIYYYSWGHLAGQGEPEPNPVAVQELNINKSTAYRGLSKLYGEIRFLKHFSFSSTFGFDFMLNEAKQKVHPLVSLSNGTLFEEKFRTANIISTNILRFDKEFYNQHNINLLAGQEAQVLNDRYSVIGIMDLSANPDQDQIMGGTIIQAQSNVNKRTLLSYFGQANYSFQNKYFLSGTIRTDGSSLFGKNNRFGTYWSTGIGWIVSAEPFAEKSGKWLNYLKIRGSIGNAGNSAAISNSLRLDPLTRTNYLGAIAVFPTKNGPSPGNPSIQWEKTFNWNAGLEFRVAKERVAIIADFYSRKTKNLIGGIEIPLGTGFRTLAANIGDIKNQGLELSVSVQIIQNKNFHWNLIANWSKNKNKLTKSFFPRLIVNSLDYLVNEVGYEYNSFLLKRWAGVNPANGRPMWIDSTGKPTEDYNAGKAEIVGNSQPDGFGSITQSIRFKGIELSATIYYQYGVQIFFKSDLQNDGMNAFLNQSKFALNRWQKPGDIAANPRRLLDGSYTTPAGAEYDFGTLPSTRYLYDGGLIRLSNVLLAYNLPKKVLDPIHLNSVKLFVQGYNLITWTKYSGQDPENVSPSGLGNILYPLQRSFSLGLNVIF